MKSGFPRNPLITIAIHVSAPMMASIRIRVPSWAQSAVSFELNREQFETAVGGTFVTLNREWRDGDVIKFNLPLGFKLTKYTGTDQTQGRERYALEYGPLLMAAVGAAEFEVILASATQPNEIVPRLRAVEGEPLHFSVDFGSTDVKFIPYYEVTDQLFSCFPIIKTTGLPF
jgi:DUF1680 family protein